MTQTEFDRLTDRPYTEEEFSKIHYIYCYYPGVDNHAAIAELWSIGGARLIADMLPTAQRVEAAEKELRKAQNAYIAAKKRYEAVCGNLCDADISESLIDFFEC